MKVLEGHCTGCKICLLICSQKLFGVSNTKKAALKIIEGPFQEKFTPVVCDQCGRCIAVCPTGALKLDQGIISLNESLCDLCRACIDVCPPGVLFTHGNIDHIIKCNNCCECVNNCPADVLAV